MSPFLKTSENPEQQIPLMVEEDHGPRSNRMMAFLVFAAL